MTVNGYEVAILENIRRIADTIDAGDPHLTSDDSAMNQHSASPFDDATGQWDQVGHRRLNRITHENFPSSELAQIVAPADAANQTRRQAR